MSRRIITTENLEEDAKIENNLRPQLLDDYIGQAKAKEMLNVYIRAARERSSFSESAQCLWQVFCPCFGNISVMAAFSLDV